MLRELRLAVSNPANSAPSLWWTSVFDSLSINTSIGFLLISSSQDLLHNGRLASTIGLSRYITRVFYVQGRKEWDPTSFVLPLSDATGDNYNLLKVDLCGAKLGDDAARCLLKIKETVRRNCGLLERAVAFNQTTTLDWRTATALEKVGSTHLDDLNIDCWRLLRQYLSFDDVKVFAVEKAHNITPK
ncbi:hypothetical protein MTO96_052410 [Rhipicephalus appendiculatus]